MLDLHLLGVHHVITALEEFRGVGKLSDVIVEGVEHPGKFAEHKRLGFTQGRHGLLVDQIETKALRQ